MPFSIIIFDKSVHPMASLANIRIEKWSQITVILKSAHKYILFDWVLASPIKRTSFIFPENEKKAIEWNITHTH